MTNPRSRRACLLVAPVLVPVMAALPASADPKPKPPGVAGSGIYSTSRPHVRPLRIDGQAHRHREWLRVRGSQ